MIMEFLVGRVTGALISIVSNIKYLAFGTLITKRDFSSNVLNNKIFSMSEYHCSKFGIVVFTYCIVRFISTYDKPIRYGTFYTRYDTYCVSYNTDNYAYYFS